MPQGWPETRQFARHRRDNVKSEIGAGLLEAGIKGGSAWVGFRRAGMGSPCSRITDGF